MLHDFVLVHQKGSGLEGFSDPWVQWKTCLRQIAFGLKDFPIETASAADTPIETNFVADIYRGPAAYAFALEVVCGLKSPLAGETEVMGQFRELLTKAHMSVGLKKILESILVDAKVIRHKHLSKLGSQSYGSLSRKLLSEFKDIHVLGSGQLTEELLPWFSDKQTVFVHGRKIQYKTKLTRDFSYVELVPLTREGLSLSVSGSALIVAAPMKALDIERWVGRQNFSKIIDLRGESRLDPIKGLPEVINLKDFYQSLESHQTQVREKVEAARADIERLSFERSRTAELRPFGWDDLCA